LGTYEPEVCVVIQAHLNEGAVAMDIGANIGYFPLLMARRVGFAGRVIAFEPVPTVHGLLVENLSMNGCHNVIAERLAVADAVGDKRMEWDPSEHYSFTARLSDEGDVSVPATSIDSYVADARLERLDFVKIDVEGAEDQVVSGMVKTLKRLHPTLLLEIHADHGGECLALTRLESAGYNLFRLERNGLIKCSTTAEGNYVLGVWSI